MRVREMRDWLDQLYNKYGDADVFIRDPDGGEPFVAEDMWAVLIGPVFQSVYIGTERRNDENK